MVNGDFTPRHSRGTPIGGQFSERILPEGDVNLIAVDLSDNKSYNSQGSAIHPPIPRDARQVVDFWSSVEMPDHLLNNIAIADLAIDWGGARPYYKDALKQHKERLKDSHRPAWRRKTHYNENEIVGYQNLYSAQLHALMESPRSIPAEELMQVARMGHAFIQARNLPQAEGDKVRSAVFPFGSQTTTPKDIWFHYALWEVEPAFFERTKYRLIDHG